MKITQSTSIVVYGAGEVGNNAASKLLARGYSVQGFLDAKSGIKNIVNDLAVYQVDHITPWDKTRVVVIIALANGNIHKDVAEVLSQKGYLYIAFLPINHFLPQKVKRRLTKEYNNILEGECEGIDVSLYSEYLPNKLSCDDGIIDESGGYIWTFVSQEILFSENYDTWKGDISKLTGIMESYNRNIVLRKWYRSLFKYYDSEIEDCEDYFGIFEKEKSESEKEGLVLERQKLFQMYKMEFNRGLDFFITTAPLVEWNNKNHYFNLVGGHHRVIFLLEQGLRMYPVKMTRMDFDRWCNYEVLEKWESLIKRNPYSMIMPMPHPAYVNYYYQRENMKVTLLDSVLNFLSEIDKKSISVLDVSESEGYFARIFSRLGVGRITCFAPDYERMQLLFELLYIEQVNVVAQLESCYGQEKYDFSFALNPQAAVYQSEEELFRLFDMTEKYIFIELLHWQESILQNFMDEGKFCSFNQISSEVIDGQKYNIYVLVK